VWVFQKTNHCGPGCCVPACLSSLTGIHIDKIIYDPHSSDLGWFDHVNNILSKFDYELAQYDSYGGNEWRIILMSTGLQSHMVICNSHGRIIHDPARMGQKKLDQLGFARIAYYGVNTIGATYI